MHPVSLAAFEKPGPSIQQKKRTRHRSSILHEHPQPRGDPLACVSVLKDNPVAPQPGFLPGLLWLWLCRADWLPAQLCWGDLYHPALWKLFHFL